MTMTVERSGEGSAHGLYDAVVEYASLGDHRTGTAVDRATVTWVLDQLAGMGAQCRTQVYEFPKFDVRRHRLSIDGTEVEALPLWYAGRGTWDTTDVLPARSTFTGAEVGPDDSDVLRAGSGQPVVMATEGAGPRLYVPNRRPSAIIDRPHTLVSGFVADLLERASVVRLEAGFAVGPAGSANAIARLGPPGDHPVIITTPLTGWFGCAGERGTGIVVALRLARWMAAEHPVLFVGTTGHELGYLGIRAAVRSGALDGARAVIHVGASLAAAKDPDDPTTFTDQRAAVTNLVGAARHDLDEAMAASDGPAVAAEHQPWLGEAEVLEVLDVPMLSVLGRFPLFHTPDDVPERATSPELLGRAMTAMQRAAAVLLSTAPTAP